MESSEPKPLSLQEEITLSRILKKIGVVNRSREGRVLLSFLLHYDNGQKVTQSNIIKELDVPQTFTSTALNGLIKKGYISYYLETDFETGRHRQRFYFLIKPKCQIMDDIIQQSEKYINQARPQIERLEEIAKIFGKNC